MIGGLYSPILYVVLGRLFTPNATSRQFPHYFHILLVSEENIGDPFRLA